MCATLPRWFIVAYLSVMSWPILTKYGGLQTEAATRQQFSSNDQEDKNMLFMASETCFMAYMLMINF